MASTTITITAADVDRRIGPVDGYVVGLIITEGPIPQVPDWNPGWGKFGRPKTNFLMLMGTGDPRPIYNIDLVNNGGIYAHNSSTDGIMISGGNLPYKGELLIAACPLGAILELTVSDTPVVAVVESLPSINVGAARRA
jgi:hypothetical protein